MKPGITSRSATSACCPSSWCRPGTSPSPSPSAGSNFQTAEDTYVGVRYSASNRYAVALQAYCLPIELSLGAMIRLEKLTNGIHSLQPPGPSIPVGDPVHWDYVVTNAGDVALSAVTVTDDQGVAVSCPRDVLAPGEAMVCTASGVATACQYRNVGTATGTPPHGPEVSAEDASHYFGLANAALRIETAVNGADADTAPGPEIPVGAAMQWTYAVTNSGAVALTGVTVTDDHGLAVSCPKATLQPGESMTCSASGVAAAGEQHSVGAVTGTPPCGLAVRAEDPGYYHGQPPPGQPPAIALVKRTNGEDANLPPGPKILIGGAVAWTYQVTNTGGVALTGVAVSDDRGVAVACPRTSLQPGESMTCTGHGTATAGQYQNLGTARGKPPSGPPVAASDPSHYFGETPPPPPPPPAPACIEIVKKTNGQDANSAPGPYVSSARRSSGVTTSPTPARWRSRTSR